MSSCVRTQLEMLKYLAKSKSKLRKSILSHADKNLITAICECSDNLLRGNIKISQKVKEQLKKYRHVLRELVEKSSVKKKRQILVQKGGFLEFLIPAVASGIAEIISSVISRPSEPET